MEEQHGENQKPKVKWWYGCLVLLGIVIVIVACFALVPESEPEKTAMDEWEVSRCGSEGYVFNVHYNAYGMFYFGNRRTGRMVI